MTSTYFVQKCEELLSKWERYTSHFLFGSNTHFQTSFEKRLGPDNIRHIKIRNVDYCKLKLCILSILWRAHVSTNNFFKEINVFENESVIRKMLLENDCKEEDIFTISILGIQGIHNEPLRLLFNPTVKKMGEGYIAIFLISGFFYFIDLQPKSNFEMFDKIFLRSNGELEVPLLSGHLAKEFLKSFGLASSIIDNFLFI